MSKDRISRRGFLALSLAELATSACKLLPGNSESQEIERDIDIRRDGYRRIGLRNGERVTLSLGETLVLKANFEPDLYAVFGFSLLGRNRRGGIEKAGFLSYVGTSPHPEGAFNTFNTAGARWYYSGREILTIEVEYKTPNRSPNDPRTWSFVEVKKMTENFRDYLT